ncbi:MAG: zinc-ribbon domain containing protein [Chloroflexi bacterium]|nr:zinc-ribbon domain containing protein [Chloroflexota bacterium]
MSFADKTLKCVDCANDFVFTSSEQEMFASKGYANEPKRCPDCRAARRQQRGDSVGGGGGYQHTQREMFPTVCAACGKETQVPFEPRTGRPVYCSACYAKVRR